MEKLYTRRDKSKRLTEHALMIQQHYDEWKLSGDGGCPERGELRKILEECLPKNHVWHFAKTIPREYSLLKAAIELEKSYPDDLTGKIAVDKEAAMLDSKKKFDKVKGVTTGKGRFGPKPDASENSPSQDSSEATLKSPKPRHTLICFKCKKEGHKAKDCLAEIQMLHAVVANEDEQDDGSDFDGEAVWAMSSKKINKGPEGNVAESDTNFEAELDACIVCHESFAVGEEILAKVEAGIFQLPRRCQKCRKRK